MTNTRKPGLDRRGFLAASAATAGLAAVQIAIPGRAIAQGYPERPINVVVMYAAGGGTDTIMRKLAEEMAAAKGWTINVLNKPGAVGGVATQFVGAAPSDGYTVWAVRTTIALSVSWAMRISPLGKTGFRSRRALPRLRGRCAKTARSRQSTT